MKACFTLDDLAEAIDSASAVWVTPRLGVLDFDVRISKVEARALVSHLRQYNGELADIVHAGSAMAFMDGDGNLKIG